VPDRFYCPELGVERTVWLSGAEAHHLARVRRVPVGGRVEVFDGKGKACAAEVVRIARDRVELVIVGEPLPDRARGCRLTLATAVPKGERFDWLVEKATELGVERIVPLLTERSVVEPGAAKLERLRRVVLEAAKQCGRNRLMELDRPRPWLAYLVEASAAVRFIADPGGRPAAPWMGETLGDRVALAVGPEGGFTTTEIAAARAAGWEGLGLGPTTLRVETAGVVGCALILAWREETTTCRV
jgi:16S rRNA (uracil1498-N3)-methyltransferase